MSGHQPPVLIAGAGPTGLATACTLRLHGVDCRVVDRRAGVAGDPKALILWSGALEVLRRLGVHENVVGEALPIASASYWSRGRQIGRVRFGTLPETAFPGPICLPQSRTEHALYTRLRELGGEVEWGTEVLSADPTEDEVRLRVRRSGASGDGEPVTTPWLVAADGSRSVIRESVGIAFRGDTYDRDFLLGDGVVTGPVPENEAQYHLTPEGVLVIVPLPGGGHRVFFDAAPDGTTDPPEDHLLRRLLAQRGPRGLGIEEIWWRSRFRVHARVAERFRAGRVLLAGDAAHLHSPAGGQGLNTGIQDGFDVGWKLAAVLRGAAAALLDSYPAERRPTAETAVRSADQQTRLWLVRSPLGRFARDSAMRLLSASGALEKRLVPRLAQLVHDYRDSPGVVVPDRSAAGLPGGRWARAGRRVGDLPLDPRSGTTAASLHEYLAGGRHTFVVGGEPRQARDVAAQVRDAVPDDADVLLLLPTGGRSAGGTAVDAEPDTTCDVARDRAGWTGAPTGAWLVYVRPDAVVGGVGGGPSRPEELLRALALPRDGKANPSHSEIHVRSN